MYTRILFFCLLQSILVSAIAIAQESDEQTTPDQNVVADAATKETAEEEKDPGRGRFLALPFVITEPAIGEGLGGGLIYFHKKTDTDRPRITNGKNLTRTNKRPKPPPTATGAFGMYTNNGTYAYGVGHARTFRDDTYRYTGVIAGLSVNATLYEDDIPYDFNLEGTVFYSNLERRVGTGDFFVGASFSYLDGESVFESGPSIHPPVSPPDSAFTDVGISVSGIYDNRDDSMMPSSGYLTDLTVWRYDDAFGGDFNYWSSRFKVNYFHKLHEKFVLGLRFDVTTASGDIPFYAVPFVPLRGIPAMRYQGETAGAVEVEGRYEFAKRWSAVAFAGKGFLNEGDSATGTEDNLWAGGVGIRLLVLKEQNFWLGLDIAQGPEEKAWYIQMGHPW